MAAHPRRANLFEPGRNCWCVVAATRAAFLIDGEAYFRAFVEAARSAQRSLLIAGWDFHSRTRLLCADEDDLELGEFLNDLVRRRRELHVHILIWDYPMIFGLDREWVLYGLGWQPHRRVHFRYDNTQPAGGCHHQKIVVIDDTVAFNGGIDLTSRRWDTCAHAPDNRFRVLKGTPYPPFHDVMMAVEGPAAQALGDLVRERWRKATGQQLQRPFTRRRMRLRRGGARGDAGPHWPASIQREVRDVDIAIARTVPATEGSAGVREIEALYLDMIAAARHAIYIENQYFTAEKIGEALAARLAEPSGPEVVVVLRELSHGWLEEVTMQMLRTRLIEKLRAIDRHGRFRVYYPYIAGLKNGTCIDVHSKLIVIDDDVLRIGSANLANRSLGLDTECDLAVQAGDRADVAEAIRAFRSQLLSEHLGCSPQAVRRAVEETGSLHQAIARLCGEERTLRELTTLPQVSDAALSVASVGDPEKPVALSDLADLFGPRREDDLVELESEDNDTPPAAQYSTTAVGEQRRAGPSWGKLGALVLGIVLLTALWKLTPLARFLDANQVTGWARRLGGQWWAPLATIATYTPAALIMFPRPLITLFAVIAFGPLLGFAYAMLGIELAAWVTFVAGSKLDRRTVRRVAGRKLHDILQVLRRRGLLAITALRLVPLAPFAVEGVVAGAARVKLSDFLLGTALGILPGTLTSTVFGDQLQVWLENPRRINYWLIATVLLVLATATWLVRRWLIASVPGANSKNGIDRA